MSKKPRVVRVTRRKDRKAIAAALDAQIEALYAEQIQNEGRTAALKELAEKSGVSSDSIKTILAGNESYKLSTLQKVVGSLTVEGDASVPNDKLQQTIQSVIKLAKEEGEAVELIGQAIASARDTWNITLEELAQRCDPTITHQYVEQLIHQTGCSLENKYFPQLLRLVGYEVPEDTSGTALLGVIKAKPKEPEWVKKRNENATLIEGRKPIVASQVQALRERLGWSQSVLSAASKGVSVQVIGVIEGAGYYSPEMLCETIKALGIEKGTPEALAKEYAKYFPQHLDAWHADYAHRKERMCAALKVLRTVMKVAEKDVSGAMPESFRVHERLSQIEVYGTKKLLGETLTRREKSYAHVTDDNMLGIIAALCTLGGDRFQDCPNMQKVARLAKQEDKARKMACTNPEANELRDGVGPQQLFYDQKLHDLLSNALEEMINKAKSLAEAATQVVNKAAAVYPRVEERTGFTHPNSVDLGAVLPSLTTHAALEGERRAGAKTARERG